MPQPTISSANTCPDLYSPSVARTLLDYWRAGVKLGFVTSDSGFVSAKVAQELRDVKGHVEALCGVQARITY